MILTNIRTPEICKLEKLEKEGVASVTNYVEIVSFDEDGNGYLTMCLDKKKATNLRLAVIAVRTSGHRGLGKLSIRGNKYNYEVTLPPQY